MVGDARLSLFAVTAPGLEPLAAAELAALGVDGVAEPGGVAFEGSPALLYAANLHLRTASRVVERAAEFRARTFFELERHADRVPWERWLGPGRPVRLRVTSRKSKLYHEGAVAQRVLEAIARRVGGVGAAEVQRGEEDDGEGDAQLFVVRFLHDRCTVSADASGALLHLRGYRQAVAKAPLRETLAAAMLMASGWRGDAPLVDPLCGAGTIVIEGALLARRIAPGLSHPDGLRAYAFQQWPGFDVDAWEGVVADARAAVLPSSPVPIVGSDRDAGAVEAAEANAARAGVAADVAFSVRPMSAMEPPQGPGWLVANPPYGLRVGESAPLRSLYAALGNVARERLAGWTVALLSADPRLDGQVRLPFREALRTRNGGIPVRVVTAVVPEVAE